MSIIGVKDRRGPKSETVSLKHIPNWTTFYGTISGEKCLFYKSIYAVMAIDGQNHAWYWRDETPNLEVRNYQPVVIEINVLREGSYCPL